MDHARVKYYEDVFGMTEDVIHFSDELISTSLH